MLDTIVRWLEAEVPITRWLLIILVVTILIESLLAIHTIFKHPR